MSNDNAIKALEAEIKFNESAIDKLDEVIAHKKFDREDVDKERNEKAKISQKLTDLEELLADIKAAAVVVTAPTEDEIADASKAIATIRDMAVKDAAMAAGLTTIKDILRVASSKLSEQVKNS